MFEKYFIDSVFEKMFPGTNEYNTNTDKNGILLIDYVAHNLGNRYNPAAIALYALSQYNMFVDTGKGQYKESFLNHANWLVDNLIDKGKFGVWYYDFSWITPGYVCSPPWISSMAQGLGISVLIRACELTKNGKYLEVAKKALASFDVPIPEGGVLYIDKKGDVWYEEYVCKKSAQVLNGVIFSLIGVYEIYECDKDKNKKDIFDKGIQTLKRRLGDFELNLVFFKSSKYDNNLLIYSGEKYHNFHIAQMKKLYEITKEEIFNEFQKKWESYEEEYGSTSRSKGRFIFNLIYYMIYTRFLRFYTRYVQEGAKR